MMTKGYRKKWLNFRAEMIERNGGVCAKCGRSKFEGATVQVHHKIYIDGRRPWEYMYDNCEVLCKGCHAVEHGLIRPFSDWEYEGDDDLGGLDGECELCGQPIRYVFLVSHPKWPALEVGEICCNNLTESNSASIDLNDRTSYDGRLNRFMNSNRWNKVDNRRVFIEQKGFYIKIEQLKYGFKIRIDGKLGKDVFKDIQSCKTRIFEILENGQLEAYFSKMRRSPQI